MKGAGPCSRQRGPAPESRLLLRAPPAGASEPVGLSPTDCCREGAAGPAAQPAEEPMLGVPLRAAVPSGWRVLQVRSLLPPGPPPWAQLCCRGIRALLWVGRPERPGLHVEMRDFPLCPSGEPDGVSTGSQRHLGRAQAPSIDADSDPRPAVCPIWCPADVI